MLARIAHSSLHKFVTMVRRPRLRRIVNRAIAMTRPRALPTDEMSWRLAANLERDGFVRVEPGFDTAVLNRLKAALQGRKCHDPWRPDKGRFGLEDTPTDTNNARIIGVEDIPEAQEIASDPRLVGIASAYLGCRPVVDEILSWWSLPGRTGPVEEQFFHRDNPSSRWLKLFIYLSDVGETEGPHTFVRGSHASPELLTASRRWTDSEVIANCGADRVMRFTGPFGTAFLEDTYGLHKGELPTGSPRLIFEITYATYRTPGPIRNVIKAGAPPAETM